MFSQIVAGIVLADGIVFGVLAYTTFRKTSAKLARCQRVWGNVIEVKEHKGSKGTTRHPVIEYKTAAGEDFTFESKYGSSSREFGTGERLEILINPDDPSDAEVVNFPAQWGATLVFAIVSISSLVAAPIIYFVLEQ